MNIVFIDPKCPKPYDSDELATRGLGGTEATVVRIARALAVNHTVSVLQHNRNELREETATLRYLPIRERSPIVAKADHVIFIQKAQDLRAVARATNGRLWLWLHNYLKDEVPFFWQDHLRYRLGIICVSRTHALHTKRYIYSQPHSLLTSRLALRGGLVFHYNPLQQDIGVGGGREVDPFKLVFFSSPHKGIQQVLELFHQAHSKEPRLQLFVADPGYIKTFDATQLDRPGVVRLGTLPQSEILRHVEEALCVFYPQTKRAETFGLIFAEANALGTPVLANNFGSAEEILVPSNAPIDARSKSEVLKTLFAWVHGGRPKVSMDPRFSLHQVTHGWLSFLNSPDSFVRSQHL